VLHNELLDSGALEHKMHPGGATSELKGKLKEKMKENKDILADCKHNLSKYKHLKEKQQLPIDLPSQDERFQY
jgi:predicted nuclease with TOPRIM domain